MSEECLPPPNTPAGTKHVLERDRGTIIAEVRATWTDGGLWNVASAGMVNVKASVLADAGWRYVGPAEETR